MSDSTNLPGQNDHPDRAIVQVVEVCVRLGYTFSNEVLEIAGLRKGQR